MKSSRWIRFATASLVLVLLVISLPGAPGPPVAPARAATLDEIETAIANGVAWLAGSQNADGSWGAWSDVVAKTCFALTKLQERAYELGYASPFDPGYAYADEVSLGWSYVLTTTRTWTQALSLQDHAAGASGTLDDPDTNGNGYGIYFPGGGSHYVYTTGICLMALDASGTPERPNDGGLDFDGDGSPDTFRQIAQEAADWLAFAQADVGPSEGGWSYNARNNSGTGADNSNSGYAVLGLAAAEGLDCTVPQWVRTELNAWIDAIQDPVDGDTDDGGSWYSVSTPWVNELKTGNLLFQMAFYGDNPGVQRLEDALDYVERHWRDANTHPGWGYAANPADYQAMYCLMRGLEYGGIALLDTDGDGVRDDDWYNQEPPAIPAQDFASVLVGQQNTDGSWPGNCRYGDSVLCAVWALLTLEKSVPERLSIDKAVTPTDDVTYHGTVTYVVVLSNRLGREDAASVLLTDTLPGEVDFGGWVVQPPGASVRDDRVTWRGTVPAGEAITLTFTARHVGDLGQRVINTAGFASASQIGSAQAAFAVRSYYTVYLPLACRSDDDDDDRRWGYSRP